MGGIQRSFNTEFNSLTLQVLNMCEIMIKLGFYTTQEETISILNPIIDLLDGSNDFTTPDEEKAYIAYLEAVS